MRLSLLSLLIASFAALSGAALAQQKPTPPVHAVDTAAFAFQGTECPAGSFDYRGPAAQIIKEKNPGLIYCRFMSNVRVLKKKNDTDKCPFGTIPYSETDHKPEAGLMWCVDDPALSQNTGGTGTVPKPKAE